MQAPGQIDRTNVLLVTSLLDVAHALSPALETDYIVQRIEDSADALSNGVASTAVDIVVVARDDVDQVYLDRIADFTARADVPILVFVEADPNRMARYAIRAGVTSFVVDGLVPARIPTLIEVTMERFKLSQTLRTELLKSQEELAARKVIERAKGLLMDKKQLNEQDAYKALRELAMRQAKPLKDVAETLIAYSDILP